MESAGVWLEKALNDVCRRVETGLSLDSDMISGLVSYCDLAPPQDAKEYLDNIVGEEAGRSVIEEYLRRRGYSNSSTSPASAVPTTKLQAYVKPPSDQGLVTGVKKAPKVQKEASVSRSQSGNHGGSKKKKGGKVVSLAEAAKGSIVFQQGKPCSCQARCHKLVSNCLSCGKIVCEQEGEGPCSFCGALVLKEGSNYAGLEQSRTVPLTEAEAAAEAYAKRLVDYDRSSSARTTVIDDQSDYYDEGSCWMSPMEKEHLRKKEEEMEEAKKAIRSKVVMEFDLVGRKVVVLEDEYKEMVSDNILRPPDEREMNRIKPNPFLQVQPIFINPGPRDNPGMGKRQQKSFNKGLCLAISGRVQHDNNESRHFSLLDQTDSSSSNGKHWHQPSSSRESLMEDDTECHAY